MKILLVDPDLSFLQELSNMVRESFPYLNLVGMMQNRFEAWDRINTELPDIVVFNIFDQKAKMLCKNLSEYCTCQFIYITQNHKEAAESVYLGGSGFVLKPLSEVELQRAIRNAIDQSAHQNKMHHNQGRLSDCIGVPSIEGVDVLHTKDIIRLEGLQRCTRIVTDGGRNIISSYPIGIFMKMLDQRTFIQTHKSHIVNFLHIRKYLREGSLIMSNQSTVPVSRRKKSDLLSILSTPEKNAD